MNKIINLLFKLNYKIELFLYKWQEWLCYSEVRKYGDKLLSCFETEIKIYSQITYYECRDCDIVFCFNDISEDSDISFDIIDCIYEDLEKKLSEYGFGILFKWKKDDANEYIDHHYKLIYTNENGK